MLSVVVKAAGLSRRQVQSFFDSALCVPVLTAHPTEIRRKSSIDREIEIGKLLDERDRIQFTPEELTANRKALQRAVLTLWQTSILRNSRLRVIDEVANGLAYYDYTFLRELPRLYSDIEERSAHVDPHWVNINVPSFLANRHVDRRRPGRQPDRDRRCAAPEHADEEQEGFPVLPRGTAYAGRRAVA